MKTQFRKELNRDIKDRLLLKDASMWAITKHVYKRFEVEILYTAVLTQFMLIAFFKIHVL
jgi:hypothetical protein